MLMESEVTKIAEPILRRLLAPYGLDDVQFKSETDHDGDPVLRAYITYKPQAPELDAEHFLATLDAVMNALSEAGDDRFLHTSHSYQDGPAAEEDYKPTKRRRQLA